MSPAEQYHDLARQASEEAAGQTLPQRRRQLEETAARWTEMAVWSEGHAQRVAVNDKAKRG